MSDLLTGFKVLAERYKSSGGRFVKNTLIEMFIDNFHEEIIFRLKEVLDKVSPEDVGRYVHNNEALPIPPDTFDFLKGFEDYLETFDEGRLFEYIAEANPLIAAAFMDMGDEGAEYFVKLKKFFIDSVKAAKGIEEIAESQPAAEETAAVEEKTEEPSPPMFRTKVASSEPPKTPAKIVKKASRTKGRQKVSCSKCGWSQVMTPEEADKVTECPQCHEPA